jgi:hypothetical protein
MIKALVFVSASDIFARPDDRSTTAAWDAFVNKEPACSWGDNPHSLVGPQIIIDELEEALEEKENRKHKKEIKAVIGRLQALPIGVFVDLET